jgi:hypothetical protein
VEFKRPQRDDYNASDNPLLQSFDMISEIRAGRFLDHKGQVIAASNEKIPASCYVIADLTPSMRKVLDAFDAQPTPDQQGFYGYHQRWGIYYEFISYNKLLNDAKKRNRIFFEKLNLLDSKKKQ